MPHSILVSELMRVARDWPILRGKANVSQAIKILRIVTEDRKIEQGRSTPLVLGDDGTLLGFLHLIDLLRNVRHLCEKADAPCELERATMPIEDLAVPFAASVTEGDSILKALDIMMDHGVSLVPVMRDGKLVGIIQLSDVFDTVSALLFDEQNPEERQWLVRRFHL